MGQAAIGKVVAAGRKLAQRRQSRESRFRADNARGPSKGNEVTNQTSNQSEGSKTKVFISYSRQDKAFAESLRFDLNDREYDAFLDLHDIAPGEKWKPRLEALILESDAVVFLITDAALGSEFCDWEVSRTLDFGKRLVPLVHGPSTKPAPEKLSALNYIFTDDPEGGELAPERISATALGKLCAAIDVDITWVREHSRLTARAEEWAKADQTARQAKLFRFGEVEAAKAWEGLRPGPSAPSISATLVEFLKTSEAKETADREERAARELRISMQAQRLVATQAKLSSASHRHARALRLTIAAEPTEEERFRGIAPEPYRRAVMGTAAQSALNQGRLIGHEAMVNAVSFSPDGAWVVTAAEDGTARVWDARRCAELFKLTHEGTVRSAAYSQQGSRIVTTSDDKTARVWDGVSGVELIKLHHDDAVTSAVFHPDGKRILTASEDGTARVWRTADGIELVRLEHTRPFTSQTGMRVVAAAGIASPNTENWRLPVTIAAFSGDGSRIVTASVDRSVRVWDAQSGEEIARVDHDGSIESAALSSDGQRVMTLSTDGTARVRDVATGEILTRFGGAGTFKEDRSLRCAACSPDGMRLVSGSDRIVRIWDARSGNELATFTHDAAVTNAQFSPDGTRVLSTSEDSTARVLDARSGRQLICVALDEAPRAAAFGPDGALLATLSAGHDVQMWDAFDRTNLVRFSHDGIVLCAVFSPDGARVATASHDFTARLWDADGGFELKRLLHDGPVTCIAYSSDGVRVLTASYDQTARVWDASTGKELVCLRHQSRVTGAGFSPNDAQIVSAACDPYARVWDARNGEEILRIKHESLLYGAAFSTDGKRLLTSTIDGTVWLWDAKSSSEIMRFKHSDYFSPGIGAGLSPDGSRVVTTAAGDCAARIWDVESGNEILRLVHDGAVNSAVFSQCGTRLVTATNDRNAYVWDAKSGEEIVRLFHLDDVMSAAFSQDGTRIVAGVSDGSVNVWDVTFAAKLSGERLVRAVARERLKGETRLTPEELGALKPILGNDIVADSILRWLTPSPDDREIDAALTQWRRHREIALGQDKNERAARAEENRVSWASSLGTRTAEVRNLARGSVEVVSQLQPIDSKVLEDGTKTNAAAHLRIKRSRPKRTNGWIVGAAAAVAIIGALFIFIQSPAVDLRPLFDAAFDFLSERFQRVNSR